MRRLFFALLFANLAYLAWAFWVTPPPTVPVNEALAKLPPLKLFDELPASQRADPNAPQKMADTGPQACLSVGPFPDVNNSAQAAALLKDKGFDPRQRAASAETTEGFWVFVGGMKNEAETDKVLVSLEHNGVRDALVMPASADAGRRVSLGLFTERARAERRAEFVRSMGIKAEVAERKIPGTLYWVDLTLPQGLTTIPLQDLFAEGVSSKVSVQPCPAATAAAAVAAQNSATPITTPPPPSAANTPAIPSGPPRLP